MLSRWTIDVDACATPFSAVASRYLTFQDDMLRTELHDQIIYANPPYAIGAKNGCAGIEACLRKLVCGDVRERSCTLIALLPALPHTDWYAEFVDRCHELYMLTGSLAFPNLFMHPPPSREGYLWVCRSYILCVWRPEPVPEKPVAPHRLEVPPLSRNHPAGEVHLRCCSHCGRIRVLPRHASPIIFEIPIDVFVCSDSPDERYGHCKAPQYLPTLF